MAPPRKVAARLRQTARKVAAITDDAVQDAATFVIERATETGGDFRWGPLGARIARSSNRGGRSTVTVIGDPPGAWSIKSYGRRGGYRIRSRRGGPVDLRRAGIPGVRAAWYADMVRAYGDNRWERLVREPARDEFRALVVDGLREGVNTDGG